MATRFLSGVNNAKTTLRRFLQSPATKDVPKGHLAVYIGETEKKRFVIPIAYLNDPSFQSLLSHAEAEFGYDHPMGGLTIPCNQNIFMDLAYRMNVSSMRRT